MASPRLRASLLVAGAGAVVVLVDLFGDAGVFAGLGAMVAGAALSARPGPGAGGVNWWGLLAAGAALALVGVPLGLALETVGGVIAAVGASLVVVAVALGLR